jgi:hypothetical protein
MEGLGSQASTEVLGSPKLYLILIFYSPVHSVPLHSETKKLYAILVYDFHA